MDQDIAEIFGLKQDIIKEFILKMTAYVQNGIKLKYSSKELSLDMEKINENQVNLILNIRGGSLLKNRIKDIRDPSIDSLCVIPYFQGSKNIITIGSTNLKDVKLIIPKGFDDTDHKVQLSLVTTTETYHKIFLEIMNNEEVYVFYKVLNPKWDQSLLDTYFVGEKERLITTSIIKLVPHIKREFEQSAFLEVSLKSLNELIERYEEFCLNDFYFKDEMFVNDLIVMLEYTEAEMVDFHIPYTKYIKTNYSDTRGGAESLLMYFNSINYNTTILQNAKDISEYNANNLSKNRSFFYKVIKDNKQNGVYDGLSDVEFLKVPFKEYYNYYKNVMIQVEELINE